MSKKILTKSNLAHNFSEIGVQNGDTVLIRASLGAVGRMEKKANTFIDALSEVVGPEGTIVSLAFTSGSWIRKPKVEDMFTPDKKSYAGALPNALLKYPNAYRSAHPMCSYIAIGKNALFVTSDHDCNSTAYEPVRKIIELHGKCMLVGCVNSSPGFTTTHLAEADLGYLDSLPVMPWLNKTYYTDENGKLKIFSRKDPGLCSQSFYKFYSLYVKEGILKTGHIGNAYSILSNAKEAYDIDFNQLKQNKIFNICENKNCFMCNAGRWDRIHLAPLYVIRKLISFAKCKLANLS